MVQDDIPPKQLARGQRCVSRTGRGVLTQACPSFLVALLRTHMRGFLSLPSLLIQLFLAAAFPPSHTSCFFFLACGHLQSSQELVSEELMTQTADRG